MISTPQLPAITTDLSASPSVNPNPPPPDKHALARVKDRLLGIDRRQASHLEFVSRILLVEKLIASGHKDWEIKVLCQKEFGVSKRQAERYMAHARSGLCERYGKDREGLRMDAIAMYDSILQDKKATNFEKLKAQERKDKILGLETWPGAMSIRAAMEQKTDESGNPRQTMVVVVSPVDPLTVTGPPRQLNERKISEAS